MPHRRVVVSAALAFAAVLWTSVPSATPAGPAPKASASREEPAPSVDDVVLWPDLSAGVRPFSAPRRAQPSFSVAWARAGQARATLVVVVPPPLAVAPAAPAQGPPAQPVPPPAPAPAPTPAPLAPASSVSTTVPEPPPNEDPWLRQRADEAAAMISYPWAELGYEVVFHPARAGMRGRTLLVGHRIEIYARHSDSVVRTAFDLAHEIAHAFDFTYGSAFIRSEWQQARGLQNLPWYGGNACDDLGTPAGDFAESFAARQVPSGDFSSRLGPRPDAVQRDLLERLTRL